MQLKNIFVHHVFFYLNESDAAHTTSLVEGLQRLAEAPIIKQSHIGIPANTQRDVVDNSYDVSWLAFFNSAEEQDAYQTDPTHLQFVKECSHLWKKVVVFDAVNANGE